MGFLSFLKGRKRYIMTHTPAPITKEEKVDSPDLIRARILAEAIVKKLDYPADLVKVADAYGVELHTYNTSGETGSKIMRHTISPLCTEGSKADMHLFKAAHEVIDRFDTEIYEFTATMIDGTTCTSYYSKETAREEIRMAIDFLRIDGATVQKIAEMYHVSRSTISNRFKILEKSDYVLWKNVQDKIEENKKVSTTRAAAARKKKSEE